jgi:Protein of unknown function (DUF2905)
MFAR